MPSQANGNPIAVRRRGSFGTMRFSTRGTPGGRSCQSQISGMVQCIESFLASKRLWPASEQHLGLPQAWIFHTGIIVSPREVLPCGHFCCFIAADLFLM